MQNRNRWRNFETENENLLGKQLSAVPNFANAKKTCVKNEIIVKLIFD